MEFFLPKICFFPLSSSTAMLDCVSSVCCNSPYYSSSSSLSHSTFPGLGFESQSKQFFSVFFPFLKFLQWSINGEYFLMALLIDRLIWVVIGITPYRIALTEVRTPDLETWNLKWHWNCHNMLNDSTRSTRSQTTLWRESALWRLLPHTVFQWVFIKQFALSMSR